MQAKRGKLKKKYLKFRRTLVGKTIEFSGLYSLIHCIVTLNIVGIAANGNSQA